MKITKLKQLIKQIILVEQSNTIESQIIRILDKKFNIPASYTTYRFGVGQINTNGYSKNSQKKTVTIYGKQYYNKFEEIQKQLKLEIANDIRVLKF